MMTSMLKIEQKPGRFGGDNPSGRAESRIVHGVGNGVAQRAADHFLIGCSVTHAIRPLGDLGDHMAPSDVAQDALAVTVADFIAIREREDCLLYTSDAADE